MAQLYTPITIGKLELKNRVAMAPMTRGRADPDTHVPLPHMEEYYGQRARDVGLIISEGTHPSHQGIGWNAAPGIFNKEQAAAWKKITDRVHKEGGLIYCQLWHTGRASHSSFQEGGKLPVAPSAIAIDGEVHPNHYGEKTAYETPRALETEEVAGVVEDLRKAATLAKEAGFDGVEVHGANGYLIDEFLQSKTNKRTDKYGGSIEKRYQLLKEVVEALLTVFEPNQIGVRISPNGVFNAMGSEDFREQFLYVAKELNGYGLAYLHIMNTAFGFHELGDEFTWQDARTVFTGPILINGGYDKEKSEKDAAADDKLVICIGRPLLTTPDVVFRFKNGHPLNEPLAPQLWYHPGTEDYLGYPTWEEVEAGKK